MRIKGTTVTLITMTETGKDAFNAPVYSETTEEVTNVLVGEPSPQEVIDSINLYGKRLAYTIAIPKGDTHVWKDQKVCFFGETFRVFGEVTRGIEENIPGPWHHKYSVERYG